ncbi:hypothetical protein [Nonomuraea dietziae]|uniref:hypothetical protein n=1 Tax=Nonomuraea dietziae TaxID=65515 RepID=UPI0034083666
MARLHISIWRRRRREQLTWTVPDIPLEDALPFEADQELWQALRELPRKQRTVLVLRFYEQLTDSERHHILNWPWVGTPGQYTPDNEPSFEEILDAETGQVSKALVRPGEEDVRCGVTTCTGRRSDGSFFHRLRDGSSEQDLPERTLGLAFDRFATVHLHPGRGQVLLDLTTGRSGDLGLRPDAEGQVSSIQPGIDPYDRLVAYELEGRYVIIDLARIR